jgi:hypothetical protein
MNGVYCSENNLSTGELIMSDVLTGLIAGGIMTKAKIADLCKGRTPEQKSVIKYFLASDGCLSRNLSDAAYEALVQEKAKAIDFRKKAIEKIGLDESQINEIPPVHFEGYQFDTKKGLAKLGKDREWRSSIYQISWLFFSNTQVYVYQYTFNLDEDGKKEATEEYFYKDITNFSTSSDTVEKGVTEMTGGCLGKKAKFVRKNVETERFALVVPGDKFYCSMNKREDSDSVIQAMKAKLREKKS